MFLIPPKSKKAAEWPPLPNERRFTRVRAACDRCRIKKTKCDGTRPCLRCRHDDVICVDNRRGDREPKMVSAEYVTMLEAQQEQLIKTLRKLHSQSQPLDPSTIINAPGAQHPGPTIQEILDNFPGALDDLPDELTHKKARKCASSSMSPEAHALSHSQRSRDGPQEEGREQVHMKNEHGMHNTLPNLPNTNDANSNHLTTTTTTSDNIIGPLSDGITIGFPRASTFPAFANTGDSGLLNSLDVGENMGMMPGGDDLPELDPSVWDGLGLDLFDRWTTELDMTGIQDFAQLPLGGDAWVNDVFCDPRALAMPEWQGVSAGVNMDAGFRGL